MHFCFRIVERESEIGGGRRRGSEEESNRRARTLNLYPTIVARVFTAAADDTTASATQIFQFSPRVFILCTLGG